MYTTLKLIELVVYTKNNAANTRPLIQLPKQINFNWEYCGNIYTIKQTIYFHMRAYTLHI